MTIHPLNSVDTGEISFHNQSNNQTLGFSKGNFFLKGHCCNVFFCPSKPLKCLCFCFLLKCSGHTLLL